MQSFKNLDPIPNLDVVTHGLINLINMKVKTKAKTNLPLTNIIQQKRLALSSLIFRKACCDSSGLKEVMSV